MHSNFGQKILEVKYMDTDLFIVSFKPNKRWVEYLKKINEDFEFCDLDAFVESYPAINK